MDPADPGRARTAKRKEVKGYERSSEHKKHQGMEPEQIRRKRLAEKETVSMMIDIRYKGSEEGEALKAYACSRIDKCPFMAEKHSVPSAGCIVTGRRNGNRSGK